MSGCKFRLASAYVYPRNGTVRPPLPEWLDPGRKLDTYSLKCSHNYWTKVYWATPPWLTEEMWLEMKAIYESALPGEHVDHMVPLKGKTVSGLHVPWNMERLDAKANLSKSNHFWPDMWAEQLELGI